MDSSLTGDKVELATVTRDEASGKVGGCCVEVYVVLVGRGEGDVERIGMCGLVVGAAVRTNMAVLWLPDLLAVMLFSVRVSCLSTTVYFPCDFPTIVCHPCLHIPAPSCRCCTRCLRALSCSPT